MEQMRQAGFGVEFLAPPPSEKMAQTSGVETAPSHALLPIALPVLEGAESENTGHALHVVGVDQVQPWFSTIILSASSSIFRTGNRPPVSGRKKS